MPTNFLVRKLEKTSFDDHLKLFFFRIAKCESYEILVRMKKTYTSKQFQEQQAESKVDLILSEWWKVVNNKIFLLLIYFRFLFFSESSLLNILILAGAFKQAPINKNKNNQIYIFSPLPTATNCCSTNRRINLGN